MAVYPGRNGMVYMNAGSGAATNVLHLKEWALDRSTGTIDTTSFGDTNKTYVQSLPDMKLTFSGFWDDQETKPFAAASSTTPISIYLYPTTTIPASAGKYAYGLAWVDCSIRTNVSGAVEISGKGEAAGSWFVGF